jgi:SAM-dependent methyltransferase
MPTSKKKLKLYPKPIIDICCGGKHFWVNKNNPDVEFMDIRTFPLTKLSNGGYFEVKPDIVADFRDIPRPDESYNLVIFDPPHCNTGPKSFLRMKYGHLDKDWRELIAAGFKEALRILKPYGTLLFKWNDCHYDIKEVLKLCPIEPLIRHKTKGNRGKNYTYFYVFMKMGK